MRKPKRHGPLYRLFIIGSALGLSTAGYYIGQGFRSDQPLQPLYSAILLADDRLLDSFRGIDALGNTVESSDLLGRWSLLALDAAQPAATSPVLHIMSRIHNRLADQPQLQKRLRLVLLVTTTDTVDAGKVLGPVSEFYGPVMTALALEQSQFVNLKRRLDIDRQEDNSDVPPLDTLFLIDPDGRLIALFTINMDAASIGQDIVTIVSGRYRRKLTSP